MTFVKGKSGNPAGRPAGTGRKIIDAISIMEQEGFCPIVEGIKLFRTTKVDKVKAEVLGILAARHSPALKAIELSTDVATQYALNVIYGKKELEQIEKVSDESDSAN